MRATQFAVVIFLSLVTGNLVAADFQWIQLGSSLEYRDLGNICTTEVTPYPIALKTESEGGVISSALLKAGRLELPTAPSLTLSAEEQKNIVLGQGRENRPMVKRLGASTGILTWILQNSSDGDCGPRVAIRSIEPADVTFAFDPDNGRSQRVKFTGELQNNEPFTAWLTLVHAGFEP